MINTACVKSPSPVENLEDDFRLEIELQNYVQILSGEIGERNCFEVKNFERSAVWIENKLASFGYDVKRHEFKFDCEKFGCRSNKARNLIAELRGLKNPEKILIVGAHYDSKVAMKKWNAHSAPLTTNPGTPGANDNASGIAALLSLARYFSNKPQDFTIRFIAFANEEPPFFKSEDAMGSRAYARECKQKKENIEAAIILDALGTYSSQPGKKRKTFGPLPSLIGLPMRTDYVAFLSNLSSRHLSRKCAKIFRVFSLTPLRQVSLPAFSDLVAWSDDWAFWQEGYQAFTVTDTAYLRADHYHEVSDTWEKINYRVMASVVFGLRAVILGI